MDPSPAEGEKRRTFLKRVATTAPILLTVAGRPAWANTCSISGMQSGNASRPGPVVCQGCSYTDWHATSSWPISKRTKFRELFTEDIYYDEKSIKRVVKKAAKGSARFELGAQAVAAALNAVTYGAETFGYDLSGIQTMYNCRVGNDDDDNLLRDLVSLNEGTNRTCG